MIMYIYFYHYYEVNDFWVILEPKGFAFLGEFFLVFEDQYIDSLYLTYFSSIDENTKFFRLNVMTKISTSNSSFVYANF